MKIYNAFIVKH